MIILSKEELLDLYETLGLDPTRPLPDDLTEGHSEGGSAMPTDVKAKLLEENFKDFDDFPQEGNPGWIK